VYWFVDCAHARIAGKKIAASGFEMRPAVIALEMAPMVIPGIGAS
jgi:hypothetical protein